MAKPVKPVVKPILRGTWHGKYATHKGLKMMLSVLVYCHTVYNTWTHAQF